MHCHKISQLGHQTKKKSRKQINTHAIIFGNKKINWTGVTGSGSGKATRCLYYNAKHTFNVHTYVYPYTYVCVTQRNIT